MIKLHEKFTDYFGNEKEQDFYFNLTEAELTDMELGMSQGLSDFLRKIIEEKNVPALAETFKKIIRLSYGEISDDGSSFVKGPEITKKLESHVAYSQIYMRLLDADEASKFIKGIIPSSLSAKVDELELKKKSANIASLDNIGDKNA